MRAGGADDRNSNGRTKEQKNIRYVRPELYVPKPTAVLNRIFMYVAYDWH